MKKYALISVSDKTGIEKIATPLNDLGYTILSTSNTFKYLSQFCSDLVEISSLTGFPEILDGRVKTLHPMIHGGILADRENPAHVETLKELGIHAIDIVIVNLYPFSKVRADQNSTPAEIIENIDIGGPTLIRAAAKNYRNVTVLTDPNDYEQTLTKLSGAAGLGWRRHLAHKAFSAVAEYDVEIADYFCLKDPLLPVGLPEHIERSFCQTQALRYGENPHQQAGYYGTGHDAWQVLHGKELSFNNLLDVDAAFRGIRLFRDPTVIIFKHTNPCGIGSGATLLEAYQAAYQTDTLSPFGGIVIVNRELDLETANAINAVFTEIIIAPAYAKGVLKSLQKKKDRRLISYNPEQLQTPDNKYDIKTLFSGYLIQHWDLGSSDVADWHIVSKRNPTEYEMKALLFGWRTVSILKSNAIALTTDNRTLGLGMGQTSRIDSTDIAMLRADKFQHDLAWAICASDGYFPFRDSVDSLALRGIKAIIQPGGSKGDSEVIAACNEHDIAMIFTGVRHFRH
ncbi:MAG: bifunctional phosphoribosylaminoimidazolecarboxamide formyltransferase/inosine monophosphate cyclohydrolase [Candidatus Cloacimonetes bacterium HGW-Cloacimonetes-1]|jgi:phosphoribosylaminoimidazolecarboxamide formyltransferase/IMP cyclohydrolase|nr:MAG: bifunctional phosphoribosylaminoimidazolecarboxamide formyltransferase/inosine monophosphate cyclohydrolase [Candidatus Cloacimonetes bacterium HGW-Cloacimonetes-1]